MMTNETIVNLCVVFGGTPPQWRLMEEAIDVYGTAAQVLQAVEELNECAAELCKNQRKRNNAPDVVSEIADVFIMMRQMALMFGPHAVAQAINEKLDRQAERMEERKARS